MFFRDFIMNIFQKILGKKIAPKIDELSAREANFLADTASKFVDHFYDIPFWNFICKEIRDSANSGLEKITISLNCKPTLKYITSKNVIIKDFYSYKDSGESRYQLSKDNFVKILDLHDPILVNYKYISDLISFLEKKNFKCDYEYVIHKSLMGGFGGIYDFTQLLTISWEKDA